MATRSLTSAEQVIARSVFKTSIVYSQVRLQDDLGMGGRPWTSPPTPLYAYYVLHVGAYFQNMTTSNYRKRLLIHEQDFRSGRLISGNTRVS